MKIHVTSEIGPLQRVLLHRPGQELEHLVPDSLERLLFDDIPYLKAAQREHDVFADTLRGQGVEVVYLEDLAAQTIAQSDTLREQFVDDFIREAGEVACQYKTPLKQLLMGIEDPKELVLKTIAGVQGRELAGVSRGPLARLMKRGPQFILDPIPNLYFTRDPFACIGEGVSLNRMYSVTRNRETIYGRYILRHHPEYQNTPLYYRPSLPFSVEGGDILNLSPSLLAVGISQRTSPEGIELLAGQIFQDEACPIQTILALDIPAMRAFMHLDTVFTQVDVDKFTVHPGILQTLRVYRLRRQGCSGQFQVEELEASLEDILKEHLGLDRAQLIRCGGGDYIAAQREQWNDGSNTLCVAPGVVVVYDRNNVTNQILRESGITVLELPSSELSRGRGGPRCMSMPLCREDL